MLIYEAELGTWNRRTNLLRSLGDHLVSSYLYELNIPLLAVFRLPPQCLTHLLPQKNLLQWPVWLSPCSIIFTTHPETAPQRRKLRRQNGSTYLNVTRPGRDASGEGLRSPAARPAPGQLAAPSPTHTHAEPPAHQRSWPRPPEGSARLGCRTGTSAPWPPSSRPFPPRRTSWMQAGRCHGYFPRLRVL